MSEQTAFDRLRIEYRMADRAVSSRAPLRMFPVVSRSVKRRIIMNVEPDQFASALYLMLGLDSVNRVPAAMAELRTLESVFAGDDEVAPVLTAIYGAIAARAEQTFGHVSKSAPT